MAILVDTSALLASAFARDANHEKAAEALRELGKDKLIVPAPVLVELFYMVVVRVNYDRAIEVFTRTTRTFPIEALTSEDMALMQAIMTRYRDAKFDFTDTAIMAVAERLKITTICTFDRRDFSVYRPQRGVYFKLLPE